MKLNLWCLVSGSILFCVLYSLFVPSKTCWPVTRETLWFKVADQIETNCAPSEAASRLSEERSSSSSSSVSCLESIFSQCRAAGRIKREIQNSQFVGTNSGQDCLNILTRNISAKLSNLDLLEVNSNRPSVITPNPTPPGTPRRASTPSAPPPFSHPPIPRHCISTSQVDLLEHSHLSSCSERTW